MARSSAAVGDLLCAAHTDLRQLITDVLMYDVVVFPCPEDEEDFARWEHNQWDPKLLATRATQLGDHVATVPWDRTLREVWKYRYDQLSDEQREDPSIAYDLTASQLAERSFLTLIGPEDDWVKEITTTPCWSKDHRLRSARSVPVVR